MTKLGDLYSDFIRIDLDARGGFARVAEVKTNGEKGIPEHFAFKVMRHEHKEDRTKVIQRFENEIDLLIKISGDTKAPSAITKIFDCGFISAEVSQNLHNRETPDPEMKIISSRLNVQDFQQQKSKLEKEAPGQWLPYHVVELAPYDDSLLRQIHAQPKDDPFGLFRFPTGEVITMAMQLLEVMQYMHTTYRLAYMDWKPEHIYWDGLNSQVKLIDWNVTANLDEIPGEKQNIRDDIRLFCGAVLYGVSIV